jgi:hypothetical protein
MHVSSPYDWQAGQPKPSESEVDGSGVSVGVDSDGDAAAAVGEEATNDGEADGVTVETGPPPPCLI